MTLPVILTGIVQLGNYNLRSENILKTALFRLRWGQSEWAVLVIEFMHLPSKKIKSRTGFWCEHEITCRVFPGFCNELIWSTWWETEWYQTKQSQKKGDILAIPIFGHQPPFTSKPVTTPAYTRWLFIKPGSYTAYETDDLRSGKVVYASWCSWCKVLCLWRCWCRKGANSCATILGKWWRKTLHQVAGKRGCCCWGAMAPKPRSVFFCATSVSILHLLRCSPCLFSIQWSSNALILPSLIYTIVLCMVQCILCFICLFFISSNIFLIH